MLDYIDPIPPILQMMLKGYGTNIYGGVAPDNARLPHVRIRHAGGSGFTRLQLISRASSEAGAINELINAMNFLERNADRIQGLLITDVVRNVTPTPARDSDSSDPEAYVYMELHHYEA